ncbi:flap endonuclease GEN homolog 1 [Lingula anatina]|uniref:Flap endonuclease GEN homolog 1 n=1 Tax=Lingula anatina TaxID=7574 RepID=A0A2R2MIH2_LINAN|nr:flap endonuclease GEN homolog 1 [Lingula anatina]XP_023930020.1 flap endonuclease GEN homolog 1 [Lingula anatina]|eukprot:XP_023930019.1 flap endonuclease GEN homolog 1 [Lingula anatina]
MGVTHLWTILDPVKEHKPLADLRGQILAVDLSMWVCETQGVKQMQGTVTRPYLRNLFFRTCHLLQLGVLPVFVVEGEPPELKWDTMLHRQQSRFGGSVSRGRGRSRGEGKVSKGRKPGRSHFKAWLRECCELLKCLGVPFVQSEGEAEAMCALLNKEGLVDGCLTDDGDAFLYGAKTVYRNFTMNSKDPHVEMFTSVSIESQLGLNREGLVGLALLLGCDYLPKGIPGVGKEMAIKLMHTLGSCNVLNRFRQWQHCSQMHLDAMEIPVYKKSQQLKDFPNEKVISEFLNTRDRVPTVKFDWKRPQIQTLQSFTLQRLEWSTEYTLDKVLPLVTMWDMTVHSKSSAKMIRLKPHRIVKSRVRQGVSCYEVEWFKESWDTDTEADYYVTVEDQVIFTMNFPEVVRMFELTIEQKKKPRRKGSKASKSDTQDVEELATAVRSINIDEHPRKMTQELRHEISTSEENIFQQKEKTSKIVSSKSNFTCTLKSALDSQNVNSSQSVATGLHPAAPKCEQNVPLKVDAQEIHSKYGENHQDEEDFDISVVPLSQRLKMRGLHSKGLGNSGAKCSFAENVVKPVPAVGKTKMVVDQIILTSEDKGSIKQDLDTDTARIGIAFSLQTTKPSPVNLAVEQSVLYKDNVISEMKSCASGVLKSSYKDIDVSQSIQERPRSNFLLNESNCNIDRGISQELSDKTNIQAESDEKVVTSPSLMNEQKVSHSVAYRKDKQDANLHSAWQLLSASHYSDSTSEETVKQVQHVTEVQNEIESPLALFKYPKFLPLTLDQRLNQKVYIFHKQTRMHRQRITVWL